MSDILEMEVDKTDGIATLTINDPSAMNALSGSPATVGWERYDTYWRQLFQDLKYDPDVRVVVITGAGDKAFSAGANVKAWGAMEKARKEKGERERVSTVIREGTTAPYLWLRALQKPSIAMVNGLAVGMGADLALACDLRIASENAWFQWAYVQRGMVPMDGACWLLPRLVGSAKALEILMTGDRITAEEALSLGIVNQVVPHDQLKDSTMELAEKLVKGPLAVIQLIRNTVYTSERLSFQESLDMSMLAANVTSKSIAEGMIAAGVEKREADFSEK